MTDERAFSADERAAWLGLLAVVELLPGVMDSQLRRELGLTHFDYHVLATLAEAADHSLSMTDVAHQTNASLTRLSHAVSRMEDRGLVERSPSRLDGRITNARLTAAGCDVVMKATPGHVDLVRGQVLGALTPSQVKQLRHIGEALRLQLTRARHEYRLHDPSQRDSDSRRVGSGSTTAARRDHRDIRTVTRSGRGRST